MRNLLILGPSELSLLAFLFKDKTLLDLCRVGIFFDMNRANGDLTMKCQFLSLVLENQISRGGKKYFSPCKIWFFIILRVFSPSKRVSFFLTSQLKENITPLTEEYNFWRIWIVSQPNNSTEISASFSKLDSELQSD